MCVGECFCPLYANYSLLWNVLRQPQGQRWASHVVSQCTHTSPAHWTGTLPPAHSHPITGPLKDIRPRLDKTVLLWGLEIGAEELPARLWRPGDL